MPNGGVRSGVVKVVGVPVWAQPRRCVHIQKKGVLQGPEKQISLEELVERRKFSVPFFELPDHQLFVLSRECSRRQRPLGSFEIRVTLDGISNYDDPRFLPPPSGRRLCV